MSSCIASLAVRSFKVHLAFRSFGVQATLCSSMWLQGLGFRVEGLGVEGLGM